MILLGISILFFALVLAGCSSSDGISSVYLTALEYSGRAPTSLPGTVNQQLGVFYAGLTNTSSLTVRTGYFGICVTRGPGYGWDCSNNVEKLSGNYQSTDDPANLIAISIKFKNSLIFSGFILVVVALNVMALAFLCMFPTWEDEVDDDGSVREVKPFPSFIVLRSLPALQIVASVIALMAMLWQHIASATMVAATRNIAFATVDGDVGFRAIILGWLGAVTLIVSTIGSVVTVLSVRTLEKLNDD